jgi:serine/threonine protein kinase
MSVVPHILLNHDCYITFLGEYVDIAGRSHCAIVKYFTIDSDTNNEYEVIKYFQAHSISPHLYPRPYDCTEYKDEIEVTIAGKTYRNIIKRLCYEYIPGKIAHDLCDQQVQKDIRVHLADMHAHGFAHADIRPDNIVLNERTKKYQLIDFGRSFSVSNSKYSPMDFMVRDHEVPTIELESLYLDGYYIAAEFS